MATNHWFQESTTKNVPKPIVKNGQPFYTKTIYCNHLCKGEVSLHARKVPVPSPHLPSPPIFLLPLKHGPPMTWAPAVEQSQAFAKVRLLTCTSSALQVNSLKMWPVHPNSESTPACFWPQHLQLHRNNPSASAFYVQTMRH